MKKQIERIIFLIALVCGVLSLFMDSTFVNVSLGIMSVVYLGLGWLLLRPDESNKFHFVYFLIGYSFATVFVMLLLRANEVELVSLFQYASIFFLVLSIILMYSVEKIKEKGVVESLIKSLVLLLLVFISMLV